MKISVQTGDIVDRLGAEKGYALIKKAGFDAIDWNLDHAWNSSDLRKGTYKGKCIFEKSLPEVTEHYSDEIAIIRANGLEIPQAHAPFPCMIKEKPETLDYAAEVYKRNIEFCDSVGCKNLVIHGFSYSLSDSINTPETVYQYNRKLYTSLIPVLLKSNVTVCLENLFSGHNGVNYQGHCSNAAEGAAFIDGLNEEAGKEVFGLCLDTGHANLLRHDLRLFISTYGKRIKALHIHDNNGSSDNHRAPLTGTVDWNHFCLALKDAGYKGDLSFETFAQTNAVLDYDEDMLLPWLKLIYATGVSFRKKIRSK